MTMSSGAFPISSRRCITANGCIQHWGIYPRRNTRWQLNEQKLPVVPPSILDEKSPAGGAQSKMGFVVLARANELFSYPTSGVVVSVKKIKEKPDEIKRVIKAGIKANRYIRQNREGTIQLMMEWMKADAEMTTATYESVLKLFNDDGSVPEKGLILVIDELKKLGKVEREISLRDVADLSILREAQRELGIK